MQMFDRLCGIAEKHLPDLIPLLREALLVNLNITPHKTLRKVIPEQELTEIITYFRLPSMITALEDRAGLTILMDQVPNQVGIDRPRNFIDVLALDLPESFAHAADHLNAEEQQFMEEAARTAPPGSCMVAMGTMQQSVWEPTGCLAKCYLNWFFMGSAEEVLMPQTDAASFPPEAYQTLLEQSTSNAHSALEEVLLMREPTRALVEVRKLHPTDVAPGHIARAGQRLMFESCTVEEASQLPAHCVQDDHIRIVHMNFKI